MGRPAVETSPAKEFFACLALRHTPGLGRMWWKRILDSYSSTYEALADAANWEARGLAGAREARACRKEAWRPAAEEEYRAAARHGMKVLTWFDPRFPSRLRVINDPPVLLYYAGDAALLQNPSVAVVGARECTRFGLQGAWRVSAELSRYGITIVSGMAVGIDRQAHLGGLSGIGRSVAVLGAGLDQDYPPANRDLRRSMEMHGLVLTEFGPGAKPLAAHFPQRNRLISGISLGVLVAEAANRSGSLITARLAADQGREVFALPGPLDEPTFVGCHSLIKSGAQLVESGQDVVRALSFSLGLSLQEPRGQDVQAQEPDWDAEASLARTSTRPRRPRPRAGGQAQDAAEHGAANPERSTRPRKRPKPLPKLLAPRPQPESEPPADLNEGERHLLDLLSREQRSHIDVLCRKLDLPCGEVSGLLVMLELRGLVRQWPGMQYTLYEEQGAYGGPGPR